MEEQSHPGWRVHDAVIQAGLTCQSTQGGRLTHDRPKTHMSTQLPCLGLVPVSQMRWGPRWAVKGTAAWPQSPSPEHCPCVSDAPLAHPCSQTCSLLAPSSHRTIIPLAAPDPPDPLPPSHSHLPGEDLCRCLQPPLEFTLTQGFGRAGLLRPEQDWGGGGGWKLGARDVDSAPLPPTPGGTHPPLDSCVEPNTDCPPGCIPVTPEGPRGLAQGQPRPHSDTRLLLPPKLPPLGWATGHTEGLAAPWRPEGELPLSGHSPLHPGRGTDPSKRLCLLFLIMDAGL